MGLNTATVNLVDALATAEVSLGNKVDDIAAQVEQSLDVTVATLTEMAEKTADDATDGIAKLDAKLTADLDDFRTDIADVNAKVRSIAKLFVGVLLSLVTHLLNPPPLPFDNLHPFSFAKTVKCGTPNRTNALDHRFCRASLASRAIRTATGS